MPSLLKQLFDVFLAGIELLFAGDNGNADIPEDRWIKKEFVFLVISPSEAVPKNRWYRVDKWKTPQFLKMDAKWDKDWKTLLYEEPVKGVTFEDRTSKFLVMGDELDFRIFLERDPHNRHDENAIKVMGSATVNGSLMVEQLGFLSRETAILLKDVTELDARPRLVYLPYEEFGLGLKIRVLTRSRAYEKRVEQAAAVKKRTG